MIHIDWCIAKPPKGGGLRRRRGHTLCLAVAFASIATSGGAGPPYVTDDPAPTPNGEAEAYLLFDGALMAGRFEEPGLGLEINIGALPHLQLSGAIALEYGPSGHPGVAAAALGAKYRFVEEDDAGWRPQISFYPQAEIALSGHADEGDAPHYLLPLWAQKSIRNWTVFGGGGYRINPGIGRRNSWRGGLAAERSVGDRLSAGAEIYGETADAKSEAGLFGIGLGLTWEMSERFELLGSAGPVFRGDHTGLAYYFALGWRR